MADRNTCAVFAAALILAACSSANTSHQQQMAAPACSAGALFKAAVAKERFNPHDPSYALLPAGNRAGAYKPRCDGRWAIAAISRPHVGTTDGITLFHADSHGRWAEVAGLGGMPADCQLMKVGVPHAVATTLLPPSQSYNGSGDPCNPGG